MESMEDFCRTLQTSHLPRFEQLPTLELYKDQLVSLTNEYLANFYLTEKPVTDTMVNNYVKLKVLLPPVKKRYQREHLARLILICLLKKVLSIAEVRQLLERYGSSSIELAYNHFCDELECGLQTLAKGEEPVKQMGNASYNPLIWHAVYSFVHKLWFEITLASEEPSEEHQ